MFVRTPNRTPLGAVVGAFTLVTTFVACANFSGEDPGPGAADAGPDVAEAGMADAAREDAAAEAEANHDAGACDPSAPFESPIPFGSLGSPGASRESAVIVKGTVFAAEQRVGVFGIYAGPLEPTGLAGPMSEALVRDPSSAALNQPSWLTLRDDGLTAFVTATAAVGPKRGLWRATRPNLQAVDFTQATLIVEKDSVYAPSVRGDTLVYAEIIPGRGYDLRIVALDSLSNVFTDVPLASLNSLSNDASAVLSTDGRKVYFGSDRAGSEGWDVWTATRNGAVGDFAPPTRVVELSSPQFEAPTWVSADDCTILLTTNRGAATDGNPGQDIYIARRPLR